MKPIPRELNLTPEQAEGVRLYRELVQRRRRQGHLRRFYAQIDAQFGRLDEETRHELADAAYREHMAQKTGDRMRAYTQKAG